MSLRLDAERLHRQLGQTKNELDQLMRSCMDNAYGQQVKQLNGLLYQLELVLPGAIAQIQNLELVDPLRIHRPNEWMDVDIQIRNIQKHFETEIKEPLDKIKEIFECQNKSPNDMKSLKPNTEEYIINGMNPDEKMTFAKALLECASIINRDTRDTLINDLPLEIRHNIKRSNVDQFDVANIVATCLNYSGGINRLLKILRLYEGDSIAMRRLEELVK